MLYRTTHHHPFIFTTTFNPFSLSSLSSPPSLLLSPTVQEMECMRGAFKNGFGSETVSFADDFSAAVHNGGGNGVSGDDLFVDELLDFSNDVVSETEELLLEPEERELQELKACSDSLEKQSAAPDTKVLMPKDHFGSLPESESTDPVEGLESLEWLSHFVEDSFSEFSLAGKLPQNPVQNRPDQTASPVRQCFASPVQTKARTKRARSGVRVWPILSSSAPSLADSSSISSSSSSNSTTTTSFLAFPFRSEPQPKKVQKRKPADVASQSQQPRKCSHCGVTKTPQWRAGPRGLKTLCNACGVRFKSGRLLPEYRPACSPTFSSELHSNNHRKVLEMRKKKEFENGPGGLAQPVAPNF